MASSPASQSVARRIYPNPPIVEAVAEFKLGAPSLAPGECDAMLDALTASYGGQRWCRPRSAVLTTDSAREHEPRPHVLATRDAGRAIRLSPDLLAIHAFAPYRGWESFLEAITDAVTTLPAAVVAAGFAAVSVRCLNRWAVPVALDRLHDHVAIAPPIARDATRLHQFTAYGDPGRGIASEAILAALPEGAGTTVFLDLRTTFESPPQPDWVTLLERLHDRQLALFESAITDVTRAQFS